MSRVLRGLGLPGVLLLMIPPALWWVNNAQDAPGEPPSTRNALRPAAASPSTGAGGRAPSGATRLYAIAVDDTLLTGHVGPGTQVEIWVRWDRRHRRPRLQQLTPNAMLEEIVPAFTPDGPDAAMLQVPASKIPMLLRAERHGELRAVAESYHPVE